MVRRRIDLRLQQLHRQRRRFRRGHRHGAQGRAHLVRQLDVGDADHRQVPRHLQAQLRRRLQHAQRGQVVGREHRRQPGLARQQAVRGVAAVVDGVVAVAQAARRQGGAGLRHRVQEAAQPPAVVAGGLAAADRADAPVAQAQQVLRREHAGLVQVHRHAGQRRRLLRPLPHAQHHRHAAAAQVLQRIELHEVRVHDDHALRQRAADRVEVGPFLRGVLVGVAHQQEVAQLARRALDLERELRIEGVGDAADEQRHRVGLALHQRARHQVGAVAQLLDRGEHAPARLLADLAAVAQHVGDGGRGDARGPRHFDEGGHPATVAAAASAPGPASQR